MATWKWEGRVARAGAAGASCLPMRWQAWAFVVLVGCGSDAVSSDTMGDDDAGLQAGAADQQDDGATVPDAGAGMLDAAEPVPRDLSIVRNDAATSAQPDAGVDAAVDAGECEVDTDCPGTLIRCDLGRCVRCVTDEDCAPDSLVCTEGGDCIRCRDHTDCDRTEFCAADNRCRPCPWGDCALCDTDDDCTPGVCLEGLCGACREDLDCPTNYSRCDLEAYAPVSACRACTEHTHCEAHGMVCDVSRRVCVECTPDTESEQCFRSVCRTVDWPDPAFTCDDSVEPGTVSRCGRCVGDGACVEGDRCESTEQGYLCVSEDGGPEDCVLSTCDICGDDERLCPRDHYCTLDIDGLRRCLSTTTGCAETPP